MIIVKAMRKLVHYIKVLAFSFGIISLIMLIVIGVFSCIAKNNTEKIENFQIQSELVENTGEVIYHYIASSVTEEIDGIDLQLMATANGMWAINIIFPNNLQIRPDSYLFIDTSITPLPFITGEGGVTVFEKTTVTYPATENAIKQLYIGGANTFRIETAEGISTYQISDSLFNYKVYNMYKSVRNDIDTFIKDRETIYKKLYN